MRFSPVLISISVLTTYAIIGIYQNHKLLAKNKELREIIYRLGKQSETFENIAIDCAKREQKL